MNARLRKLLEERATAWSKVQDIQARRAADGYDPTAEDGEAFTRALDDVERLSTEIEAEERAARIETVMNAPAPGQGDTNPRTGERTLDDADAEYRDAWEAYMRSGASALAPEQQRVLQGGLVKLEGRAQATAPGAAGGFTVPPAFLNRLNEVRKAFGGIAGLAETIPTDTGAEMPWPTNDDTANEGEIIDENTQVTEGDLTFGQRSIKAWMYSSRMVRVSYQLLQDSGVSLEAFLPRKLGERLGRVSARHWAQGTGTGQPQGLVTGLTKITETATAGKIGYDDLIDVEHSVDPAYRNRARYVLHDDVLRELRKLKDTTGRPLWVPAVTVGAPSTVNGRAYTVDNSLPEFAAGAKPLVFGDIEAAYLIREVRGAQTMRLAERYADYFQIGFLGFQRLDGAVQDTQAAAVLTVSE